MKSATHILSEILQYRALCDGQDTRHKFSAAEFNCVYPLLKDRFQDMMIVINEHPNECVTIEIPANKTTRKKCINCQILGMQKTVDAILDFDFIQDDLKDEIATSLVNDLNIYIEKQPAFDEDADHKLALHVSDGKNFSTKLVPR